MFCGTSAMGVFEAIILGLIQGLTEFLPVSSSGHLEIGKALLGVDAERSLLFTVLVHGATVLSTLVVFRRDLASLILGFFSKEDNGARSFIAKILVSMVPVLIVGLFFKPQVEALFDGHIRFVGMMLWVTASLLFLGTVARNRGKGIRYIDAMVIGLAQAVAVVPGISRSGATIATGLMLGNDRKEVARFSFLMVIIPILGANIMDIRDYDPGATVDMSWIALSAGFIAAFLSGWLACRWMIRLVQRGRLSYFAMYCLLIGALAIFFAR